MIPGPRLTHDQIDALWAEHGSKSLTTEVEAQERGRTVRVLVGWLKHAKIYADKARQPQEEAS